MTAQLQAKRQWYFCYKCLKLLYNSIASGKMASPTTVIEWQVKNVNLFGFQT
jgi:hypothetical protein